MPEIAEADPRNRPGMFRVLRPPRVWVVPAAVMSLVVLLLSLFVLASGAKPYRNMSGLPIALVVQDTGQGAQQLLSDMQGDTRLTDRLMLERMTLEEARKAMDRGHVFGAVVIPDDYSLALSAITPGAPPVQVPEKGLRPSVDLLTNPRAGNLRADMFVNITQPAMADISKRMGAELAKKTPPDASAADRTVLNNPVDVVVTSYAPLSSHTGGGLGPLYYTLLIAVAGFAAAMAAGSAVDRGLRRADAATPPADPAARRLTRSQHLALVCALAAAMAPVASFLILLCSADLVGMETPHRMALWLLGALGVATTAVIVQALISVFGRVWGQFLGMLTFLAVSLPTSGAMVPRHALPPLFRDLTAVDPVRHLVIGVRAVLYFDARGDAGIDTAWLSLPITICVALAVALAVGAVRDRRIETTKNSA